jgi:hypothetical protein
MAYLSVRKMLQQKWCLVEPEDGALADPAVPDVALHRGQELGRPTQRVDAVGEHHDG